MAWFALIALGHVVVRVAVSPALKWDEAEQILWTQDLLAGYGPQPPLYTWLQWCFNAVFGSGVLALALLKHMLLALAYGLMFCAARVVLGPRAAFWAAAGMSLIPALGWFSVRDQTHTVLVTTLACGAWWLFVRVIEQPQPARFAALGLVCGLGMLAKYNFALFAGTLWLAALSVEQTRRALLARGWWWMFVIAALVVLPHALWLLDHLQMASGETLQKMNIQPEVPLLTGLVRLAEKWFGSVLLWALALLAVFGRALWRRPAMAARPAGQQWLARVGWRYLALVMLVLMGLVLVAHVSNFKDRWLLPLMCGVPLLTLAWRPELDQHPRGQRLTGALAAFALIALAAAGIRPWLTGQKGTEPDELNHPARELAAALAAQGYDGAGRIIGADHMLAGMLRSRFPNARAAACNIDHTAIEPCVTAQTRLAEQAGEGWLLISRADRLNPDWWPQTLAALGCSAATCRMRTVMLPFHMVGPEMPPAQYQFIWRAAAPAQPPLAKGAPQ
ncbi:MAG: glycosyltransferase family 39 protein [Burkholderiaceae bacterium]|nr:glycosyltransferase family 39 protein [Burkholderiaceae bacterium]